MGVEQVLEIVSQINVLLPQFSEFIGQFNQTTLASNFTVEFDPQQNITLYAPKNMSSPDLSYFSLRLRVIHDLILTRSGELEGLIEQGYNIENELKKTDSNYSSLILDKANEFKKLKNEHINEKYTSITMPLFR
jgi:hypothetical protein